MKNWVYFILDRFFIANTVLLHGWRILIFGRQVDYILSEPYDGIFESSTRKLYMCVAIRCHKFRQHVSYLDDRRYLFEDCPFQ